ncbi:hypothetical protein [Fusobacterium sp. 1001295B_180824_G3]|uniref:hypothetical protein n=1 Tax=Fusobacterium sp. 1001295B_180824_G3 TaxID=2787123 RepID=UPI001896BD5D|nr:hypothetical protein [Fusobacterium sp. 1001295B_180824_G3]
MKNIKEIRDILKNFLNIFSPLIVGFFVTGISLAILEPYMASKHQVYNDIILEFTALSGTNKSGELLSFWISMFIGITIVIIFLFYRKDKIKKSIENSRRISLDFVGIGIFILPIFFVLIVKQETNLFFLILGFIYFLSNIFVKDENIKKYKFLVLFIMAYFFSISLKIILDRLIKNFEVLPQDAIYLLTILIFILVVYFLKKKNFKNLDRAILILQIPIPFILLNYITNEYILDGEKYIINYPKRYISLILLLLLTLVVINIFQYRSKKNSKNSLILLSTIIVIFIVHYYIEPKYVHYGDFWHWGEEVLPWNQLINKKMELYKEYSGTSGLYGLVQGFFQNIFLKGSSFSYFPALSLVNIFWMVLVGLLCYFLVGGNFSLILSLIISLPLYDRINMLMISFLLLANSHLIKKRVQWLQIYVLLSILSVFYYYVNGVALIIGAFPFAIIQLFLIKKEKLYLKQIKSKIFWLLNILLIFPIVLIIKYILRLIKLILLLSSQSKLADGIVLYGILTPPEWFMKFIINTELKKQIWYVIAFLGIIFVELVFVYLLYLYFQINSKKNILNKLKKPEFFILSFSCIALLINYSFTTIRMDNSGSFTRPLSTIIVFIGFSLLIFLYKYGNKLLGNSIKIIFISLSFASLFIIGTSNMVIGADNLVDGNEVKNIKKRHEISSGFVYVDGDEIGIPKLGKGFIIKERLDYLRNYKEISDKLLKENESFWPEWNRELLVIFNKKVPTKIDSPYLTKSLKATRENLNSMKEKPVFITDLLGYQSYYTFRWILDNGYINYNGFWIRPDRYEEVFENIEEAKKNTIENFSSQELAKIPYSLGNSMQTLDKIFINKKEYDFNSTIMESNQVEVISNKKLKILDEEDPYIILKLPEIINGNDYDFIYLELEEKYDKKIEKRMQIFWEGEGFPIVENRSIRFNDVNGKLLIPMGVHASWVLSNIIKIRIDFEGVKKDEEIEIKKLEFMKLDRDRKEK